MVKTAGKRERNAAGNENGTGGKLKDDVDAVFKLPLAEFIDARNKLAARLKQGGSANDAGLVKALAKPSISAWAANQLYWKHREAFDRLVAAGQRFRQVQMSGLAGKAAEMRASLDARRAALSQLSDLATSLLQDSGHNPTSDILRRITANLEAISAHASLSHGSTSGRLTHDVDPPGFESFGFSSPGNSSVTQKPARVTAPQELSVAAKKQQTPARAQDLRQAEATRQKIIAAAKGSLKTAERLLSDARAKAKRLEAVEKEAKAEVAQAQRETREAEKRFKSASLASAKAAARARSIADELKAAAKAVEEAKAAHAATSPELESLLD
ncbi:MAG TPA: hypothetical protein VGO56_12305 [Pyrinomonadaceae bacterium]|jgi:DNA repair exonuclease SbcCD ATPase subunit|nr:hypothetical protein [Pyrinomonadaceae bacterium]